MKRIIDRLAKPKDRISRKKIIFTFIWGTFLHWGIIPPLLIFSFRRIDHYLPSLSILPPYNYFLGGGTIFLGIIWTLASILDQWRIGKGTFVPVSAPTQKLVMEGAYKYTRNPMYLGYILLFGGIGLILNSIAIIFGLLPLIVLVSYLLA